MSNACPGGLMSLDFFHTLLLADHFSLITFRKCTSCQRWCINSPISYRILADLAGREVQRSLSCITNCVRYAAENYNVLSKDFIQGKKSCRLLYEEFWKMVRNIGYLLLFLHNRATPENEKYRGEESRGDLSNPKSRTVWKFRRGGVRSNAPARFPTERTRLAGWRVIGGNWYTLPCSSRRLHKAYVPRMCSLATRNISS